MEEDEGLVEKMKEIRRRRREERRGEEKMEIREEELCH